MWYLIAQEFVEEQDKTLFGLNLGTSILSLHHSRTSHLNRSWRGRRLDTGCSSTKYPPTAWTTIRSNMVLESAEPSFLPCKMFFLYFLWSGSLDFSTVFFTSFLNHNSKDNKKGTCWNQGFHKSQVESKRGDLNKQGVTKSETSQNLQNTTGTYRFKRGARKTKQLSFHKNFEHPQNPQNTERTPGYIKWSYKVYKGCSKN